MRALFVIGCMALLAAPGCVGYQKPDLTVIGGGVGKDTIARVYQEHPRDTNCSMDSTTRATSGCPHDSVACGNTVWSVQWRNDHPTDQNEEKYGVDNNATLRYDLNQWHDQSTVLRFYWIRYADTGCSYSDSEVVYCAEPADFSVRDSRDHGCIANMDRTFPGLQDTWNGGA